MYNVSSPLQGFPEITPLHWKAYVEIFGLTGLSFFRKYSLKIASQSTGLVLVLFYILRISIPAPLSCVLQAKSFYFSS